MDSRRRARRVRSSEIPWHSLKKGEFFVWGNAKTSRYPMVQGQAGDLVHVPARACSTVVENESNLRKICEANGTKPCTSGC